MGPLTTGLFFIFMISVAFTIAIFPWFAIAMELRNRGRVPFDPVSVGFCAILCIFELALFGDWLIQLASK